MQADGIPADDIPDELVGLIIPWLDRWVLLSGKLNNCTVCYIPKYGNCNTKYGIRDGVYARYPEEPIGIGTTFIQEYVYDDGESRWFPGNDGGKSPHHLFPEHAKILKHVRDARRKVVDPVDRCLVHGITVTELPLPEIELAGRTFRFEKDGFVHDYCVQPHEMFMSNINPQQRMNEWIDDFLVSFEWYWSQKSSGIDYKNYMPHNLGDLIAAHARQRFHESFNSLTIDGNAPEFAAPDHE